VAHWPGREAVVAAGAERYVGHTRVVLVEGGVLDHPREAVYTGGNARGVMASGTSGAIRRAGGEAVELRLREQLPLLLGVTYLTEPGALSDAGVRYVAYGVIAPRPGDSPTRAAVEAALYSALAQIAARRVRSLTVPEVGARIPGITLEGAADLLVDILTTAVRRTSGIDEVVIASTHPAYLRRCDERLAASVAAHG